MGLWTTRRSGSVFVVSAVEFLGECRRGWLSLDERGDGEPG